jgi:hypothetical protein
MVPRQMVPKVAMRGAKGDRDDVVISSLVYCGIDRYIIQSNGARHTNPDASLAISGQDIDAGVPNLSGEHGHTHNGPVMHVRHNQASHSTTA